MFRSVTAGMDGTRESFAAVDWAAREAQLRHVPLQLIQVRETGAYPYTPLADDEVEEEWAQTVTNEVLDELNRRAPELQTNVELVSGRPAHVLCGVSAKTDLLVLGSRGLGSLLGFIVGSTTLPTVAHTACPAILVRAPLLGEDTSTDDSFPSFPASPPPDGDIVVGLDLSRPCDELIAFGFETAARRSAALRVLYAWDLPASYGIRPLPMPPAMTSELLAVQNQALAAAVQPWQQSHPDVKVHAEAEIGQPARLLVEAASQASLLVVGRRNRRSRIGTHLGPVTHAVMHHARTPVAVVPHD
jgi:nucleotide-binding universal stress UspA family protein